MAAEAPESLEELVEQGVSDWQIAQIMHTTPQAVRDMCAAKGLPIPEPPPNSFATRTNYEPNLSEDTRRALDAQANFRGPAKGNE